MKVIIKWLKRLIGCKSPSKVLDEVYSTKELKL